MNTEKLVIRWVSGVSAAITAVAGVLTAYPGDVVPQAVTLVLMATSVGLAALVAVVSKPA